MAATAYIGLGSNLGDRRAYLDRALAGLRGWPGVEVTRISSVYETAPVGGPAGQGPYLNAVAELRTDLAPEALLQVLLAVESGLGRVRAERDGPRTIDLDLLLYGDLVREDPQLILPHPRLHQRLFVLQPLAEIAPGLIHPVLRRTIADLLADLLGLRPAGPSPGRELAGLRALVTGSTSGIGRAIALELARAGADVIVHGRRSAEAAEATAEEVRRAGGRAAVLLADLRDRAACQRLAEQAWHVWGGLDVCVNNAGADTLTGEAAALAVRAKAGRTAGRGRDGDDAAGAGGRPAHEGGGRRRDPEHGLGPGRDRHGGRQRRTVRGGQGSGHGVQQEPGAEPGAGSARPLPGARLDSHGLGRRRVGRRGRSASCARRRCGAGACPEDVAAAARWLVSPAARYLTGQMVRVNGGAVR